MESCQTAFDAWMEEDEAMLQKLREQVQALTPKPEEKQESDED